MEEELKSFEEFPCIDCGKGMVRLAPGKGRTFHYGRGLELSIPDAMQLPTCEHCSELYMDPATMRSVKRALRPHAVQRQKRHFGELMNALQMHGRDFTQAEVAGVLG